MSTVQFIEYAGKPAFAVLPLEEYTQLKEAAEDRVDAARLDALQDAISAGEEEIFPEAVVSALLNGANPIRLFREYRLMGREDLAAYCAISCERLEELEKDPSSVSLELLRKFSLALSVDTDFLI